MKKCEHNLKKHSRRIPETTRRRKMTTLPDIMNILHTNTNQFGAKYPAPIKTKTKKSSYKKRTKKYKKIFLITWPQKDNEKSKYEYWNARRTTGKKQ